MGIHKNENSSHDKIIFYLAFYLGSFIVIDNVQDDFSTENSFLFLFTFALFIFITSTWNVYFSSYPSFTHCSYCFILLSYISSDTSTEISWYLSDYTSVVLYAAAAFMCWNEFPSLSLCFVINMIEEWNRYTHLAHEKAMKSDLECRNGFWHGFLEVMNLFCFHTFYQLLLQLGTVCCCSLLQFAAAACYNALLQLATMRCCSLL